MNREFKILISDSNPYVRSFLTRELLERKFQVVQAGNAREIFEHLNVELFPDLLVFGLETPVDSCLNILKKIQNMVPPVPIVIYTHLTEYENHPYVQNADAFVEKNGDPDELIRTIEDVLQRHYAHFSDS